MSSGSHQAEPMLELDRFLLNKAQPQPISGAITP
jgi:hypothetical protein